LTYKEYETQALQVAAGLRKLGLEPHDKVHLFATTRLVTATFALVCRTVHSDNSVAPIGLLCRTPVPRKV
jgi:long-subunit acyl-CoA synthetase (AMP-forming)